MNGFRFRAAAALELRRKEENDAGVALARAEAGLRASEQEAQRAEVARGSAQQRLLSVERHGSDVATLMWHRNWIVRLSNDLANRQRQVEAWTDAVRQAERQWRLARQRRLALERMQERAQRRFKQEQLRQELKVIDELARLRYVTAEEWRDDT